LSLPGDLLVEGRGEAAGASQREGKAAGASQRAAALGGIKVLALCEGEVSGSIVLLLTAHFSRK
jgi:hypothetical protein